ncbi:MAG: hypothetical protein ACHQET_09390 [Chitinophagales bacterium]
MWKQIEESIVSEPVSVGNIITECPDDLSDQFEISDFSEGIVKAYHPNERNAQLIILYEELLAKSWWVKMEGK